MGHGRLCPLQLAGIIRPPDVAAQKRPPAVEDEVVGRLWSACSESTSPVLGELRRKISNVAQDLCGEACCVEAKVLHQRSETLNGLHSSLPSHRPTRRVDTQINPCG